ncbi:MAG: hypothetical protein R3B70_12030 [Polyangiaceae bacterium]
MDQPAGHVEYIGTNFHHNLSFLTSDFAASGFLMYNVGSYESAREDTSSTRRSMSRASRATWS